MRFGRPQFFGVLFAVAATLTASGALSLADSHKRDLNTMASLGVSAVRAELEPRYRARQSRIAIGNRRARRGPYDKARDRGPQGAESVVGSAVDAPADQPGAAPTEQAPASSAPGEEAPADPAPGEEPPTDPALPPAPSGEDPPANEDPPAENPPANENPPGEDPPVNGDPPAEDPVQGDPVTEPPAEEEPNVEPGEDTSDVDPNVPVTPPLPGAVPLTMAIDGGYAGWGDTEIAQRTALGAAVTRHEWDLTESVDAQDELVEYATGTIGTRLHALIGANELGDPTHYKDFVIAFLRRYGVGGSFWDEHPGLDGNRFAITSVELGNEPYFGGMTGPEYADAVRPALQEIDRLDLPVTVMVPAYLHGDSMPWLERVVEGLPGLGGLFEGFAFHPYWYGHHPATEGDSGPFERIETLREWMDEQGFAAKRIYLTEYGESTASCGEECVSETEQAAHLTAMIDTVIAHPEWRIAMLSVFQLRDRGTNDPDRELQFGLLRQNGTPKPSYAIVKAAMQLFR